MDHNNQIYSWLLCVERSWSPETTREKKTVRTVAHRGAPWRMRRVLHTLWITTPKSTIGCWV